VTTPAKRPRILFVQRANDDPTGGDAIYETRMIAALRETMDVDVVAAARRSKGARIAGMVRHLTLPDQTAFGGAAEVEEIAWRVAQGCDAVVFSHEYLDLLAQRLKPRARARGVPFVSIRHNVTSDMLRSYLERSPAAGVANGLWRMQERGALKPGLYEGLAVLSHRDRALVREIGGRADVVIATPGAPKATPLVADAVLVRDLVIGGSFGWFAKRRDIYRFTEDFLRLSSPPGRIVAEGGVPEALATRLGATPAGNCDFSAALRFGVITDRFTAGHKLKTSAYLQNNCIVLSFADVAGDFAFDARHRQFIVRLTGMDDIKPAMDRLVEAPVSSLRAEFAAFKDAVGRELAWSRQGEKLAALVGSVIAGR